MSGFRLVRTPLVNGIEEVRVREHTTTIGSNLEKEH